MSDDDRLPISARQANALFADWKHAPGLVLAVSGGPDSVALMWLVARWRSSLARGPRLLATTVDHGLRPEAAREAREVKRLARDLGIPHRTMRWTGEKPASGVPAAARAARYRLLAGLARQTGASHVLTAHTRDDQAETLLMRLLRGSGIGGLAAMARESEREGVLIARPFLNVAKSQLIATLQKAGIGYADDPTNRDVRFTRPRIRAVIEQLRAEGGDARNLARLASRLARANAAIEILADGAARYLALKDQLIGAPTAASDTTRMQTLKRPLLQDFPRKSGCVYCCVPSIGSAMRVRRNSARRRLCWPRWTAPCKNLRKASPRRPPRVSRS